MKYVNLEQGTNRILGWYDKYIHARIPEPNIEVSDEVWQLALDTHANCYENGEFIIKDFRTQEEIDEEILKLRTQEARRYLNDTDWYVTRKMETGVEIPEEVTIKRAEARELINILEVQLGGLQWQ